MPGTTFDPANWEGYDEATVTNPGSALTDFTLLIDVSTLSASWKAAVQSDGADIRVTKGDGTTELPYDLIDWAYNAGAPTGWIRAKWTGTLAASGTQQVRVWADYTPGTATAYDASETYGRYNAYASHWEAYWPLHDLNDRTASAYALTAFGSPTAGAAGKVGACYEFDGSSDYLQIGSAVVSATPLTIMAWGRSDSSTASQYAASLNDGSLHQWSLNWGGNAAGDPVRAVIQDGPGTTIVAATTTGYSAATWHHGAAKFTSSTSRDALIDGGSKGSGSVSRSPTGVSQTEVGRLISGGYFDGRINEVQVHSAALSDDWIAHEYEQSDSQATFWGTWSWMDALGIEEGSFSSSGTASVSAASDSAYGTYSSAGTCDVLATASSTHSAVGTSSGVSSPSSTGSSTSASDAGADGTSSASSVGAGTSEASFSASASGDASSVGAPVASSVGSSEGSGATSWVGEGSGGSVSSGAFSGAGTATCSAIVDTLEGVASSSGSSATSGALASVAEASGSIQGQATTGGTGAGTSSGVGSSAGSSLPPATGASTAASSGSSSGLAEPASVGAGTWSVAFATTGESVTDFVGQAYLPPGEGIGFSDGFALPLSIGASVAEAVMNASGLATASSGNQSGLLTRKAG